MVKRLQREGVKETGQQTKRTDVRLRKTGRWPKTNNITEKYTLWFLSYVIAASEGKPKEEEKQFSQGNFP